MRKPKTVSALTELGRVQLSRSFFMRDFLYSEIAMLHGLLNVPDDPDSLLRQDESSVTNCLSPSRTRLGALRFGRRFVRRRSMDLAT